MTPGPWHLAGRSDDGSYQVRGGDGSVVATVYKRGDANCISATPELCEAAGRTARGRHRYVGVNVFASIFDAETTRMAGDAVRKAAGK